MKGDEMIGKINDKQLKNVPQLAPGDTVRVHAKIIEGSKERIQIFEGVVLRVKGDGINTSFTVRKISYGVGVERLFLLHSPKLAKVQVVKRAKVRRAYLTYLRELRGKSAKLRDKQFDALAVNIKEEELKPEDLAPPKIEEAEETQSQPSESINISLAESTEEIAEEETKLDETAELADLDESEAPEVEVTEGLAEAQKDIKNAEALEGKQAEKKVEELT